MRKIVEAVGGIPHLHIVDMRYPGWTEQVLDLTDGVGTDKIADFTSDREIVNTEIDLVRHDGVIYIQETSATRRANCGSTPTRGWPRRT